MPTSSKFNSDKRALYKEIISVYGSDIFEKEHEIMFRACERYEALAQVYIDGFCHLQGTSRARAGFGVFWGDGHKNNYSGKVHGIQDKKRAGLSAVNHALRQAVDQDYYAVKIITDSTFVEMVIDGTLEYDKECYQNYRYLIYSIKSMSKRICVSVEYVDFLAGNHGSEEAYRLARTAIYPKNEVDSLFEGNSRTQLSKTQERRATKKASKLVAEVYTDGSCHLQGTHRARAGFGVFWGHGHRNNYSGKVHGIQENNRAELSAAHHAIKQAIDQDYYAIKIIADSTFVKMVIDGTLEYQKSCYQNYHDLIYSIKNMIKRICVTVELVKGHDGNHGNEEADRLAKIATYPDSDDEVEALAAGITRIHLNKTHKRRAQKKRQKARIAEARTNAARMAAERARTNVYKYYQNSSDDEFVLSD